MNSKPKIDSDCYKVKDNTLRRLTDFLPTHLELVTQNQSAVEIETGRFPLITSFLMLLQGQGDVDLKYEIGGQSAKGYTIDCFVAGVAREAIDNLLKKNDILYTDLDIEGLFRQWEILWCQHPRRVEKMLFNSPFYSNARVEARTISEQELIMAKAVMDDRAAVISAVSFVLAQYTEMGGRDAGDRI